MNDQVLRVRKRLLMIAAWSGAAAGIWVFSAPLHAYFQVAGSTHPLSFEVASVRPSGPLPQGWRDRPQGRLDGGRYTRQGISLKAFLQIAFELPSFRVLGPKGFEAQKFDIVASMPPDTSDAEVLQMLQTLLIERFKIQMHREKRTSAIYALTIDKKGLRLNPSREGTSPDVRFTRHGFIAKGKSLNDLAGILMFWVDRPVVDMTGVNGLYDFTLDWDSKAGDVPRVDPFGALDSLTSIGLRALPKKTAVEFLIIDHVERVPVEN